MTQKFTSILLGSVMLAGVLSTSANAKSWIDQTTQNARTATNVVKDDMIVMRTDKAFKEVRVANPEIADVVVLSDQSFQVLGKAGGKTNVMLYDANRQLVDIVDVTVGFDIAGLKKSLFDTFPKERIEIRPMAGGIYMSGNVSNEAVSNRAEKIAQAYAANRVTNGLTVRDSHQVMLEVRFVEASRDAIKQLGVNILSSQIGSTANPGAPGDFSLSSGSGIDGSVLNGILAGGIGGASLNVRLQALEDKGIIRTLAEPNLVSMSGETASFLAGGEYPIPVPTPLGDVAIEYRTFGVGLAFTPTVLDDGIINLKVAPEVSQLDQSNSVRIGGVEVPGLRVRRAKTTIELRNSQSFAIAGLLQNESSNRRNQVPWLGDIPVLGSLFSSTRYQTAETELVIIVTPHLAKPVSDKSKLATPLDNLNNPSDFEAFVGSKLDGLSEEYGNALQ